MTAIAEHGLLEIEIFSPEFAANPHEVFGGLRDRGATIARSERGIEVLGYDMTNSILRDRSFYWPGVALMESNGIVGGPVYDRWSKSLINLNGEAHGRLRRLAMLGFNRASIEKERAGMALIVEELLDELLPSPAVDFAIEFAQRLPSLLFCKIIGSPLTDAPLLAQWSLSLNKMLYMDPDVGAEVERAWLELEDYVDAQIIERRKHPGMDLLSSLLAAEERDARLTRDELTNLMVQILLGSTDSTANQLCLTVLAISKSPGAWQQLGLRPELIPAAVEEGLRVAPRQIASLRISDADVTFAGLRVEAGTMIGVCVAAANRDPAVFSDPEAFRLDRPPGKTQLSFGAGVHSCIGSGLARVEMEEALGVLTRRVAGVHELPGAEIYAKGGHVIEVYKMPLELATA